MNDFRSLRVVVRFIVLVVILVSGLIGCSSPLIQKEEDPIKFSPSIISNRFTDQQDSQPVWQMKPKTPIRAIYVSSYVANSQRIKELIDLVNRTELNAMVLDINSGILLSSVAHRNNTPIFAPSTKKSANHFRQVIQKLKNHHIYLIARITAFKDPDLASRVPAWTLKQKNGTVWRDRSGTAWIDPFRQEAWKYKMDMAEYAAELGFDEVQFDYVRFPENGSKVDAEVTYANPQGWTKSEAIRRFLHRASIRCHKKGIRMSADVFGMVGSLTNDMGIGQSWNLIAKEVDVISPMIYPSHYSKGTWGIDNPDLSPGPIITHALRDAAKYNKKLKGKGIETAKVRPWLQAFTAGWLDPHQKYGAAQIREQIQAARNAGFNSYMLWNSSSRYPIYNK
ncbi:putative glycoside hydrolase [Cohnella sp.]|uniref:putative glycoside hydrolase n=1 Tax=Cohnella sp. TaxID=1883426 RepID=UPI003561ECD8